jgi:undecaprenyl-diphosphatase
MSYLQIAILALIQGAAELLPVSSSAHVIMAERWMGLDPSAPEMTFLLIMLHTGTMFAVLVYFWERWKSLLLPAALPRDAEAKAGSRWHFLLMIVLATGVTGVVFLGIEKALPTLLHQEKAEVEYLFKNLHLIAAALFAVGCVIIAAGIVEPKGEMKPLTAWSSFLIGLIQGVCVPFRGFSRSGATISMGLFCRLPQRLAEEFSFALAVVLTPPAIGRLLLRLLKNKEWHGGEELLALLLPGMVGMVFSFIAGLLALRLLSGLLERGKWKYFGYYCLGAAAVVLVAARNGW